MALTDRTDSAALIPEPVANQIIQNLTTRSATMALFRQARMSVKQERMPVLDALPTAYFVSGDTGFRKTTKMVWDNKYLIAEVMSVIVPVPKTVLADSAFDMWGEVRPRLEEAIALALDDAVFFGTNKPASFPTDVSTAIAAASTSVVRGTASQKEGGIAEDINQLMGKVEANGFGVNGFVSYLAYKRFFRGARDANGQKLLDVSTNSIEGQPIAYAMPGIFPSAEGSAELFAADWSQFIVGVRQDMTWDLWKEASIYDTDNTTLLYALAQQGLVALVVDFRVAWQVANAVTRENADSATRYPAGALVKPGV